MRQLIPAIIGLSIALPAFAEASTPTVTLPLDLQFQGLALEPEAQVEIAEGLSLQAVFLYESVNPNQFGAQELMLRREGEMISLWVGKFNPQFGNAWDQETAPLQSHAGSYQVTQRFGFGGSLAIGKEAGSQLRVIANLFGDPEDPSYTLTVEAQPVLGVTLVSAVKNADQEMGLLLGATAEFSVGERSIAPLLEVAQMADHMIVSTGISLHVAEMRYCLQHSAINSHARDESIVQATASWSL